MISQPYFPPTYTSSSSRDLSALWLLWTLSFCKKTFWVQERHFRRKSHKRYGGKRKMKVYHCQGKETDRFFPLCVHTPLSTRSFLFASKKASIVDWQCASTFMAHRHAFSLRLLYTNTTPVCHISSHLVFVSLLWLLLWSFTNTELSTTIWSPNWFFYLLCWKPRQRSFEKCPKRSLMPTLFLWKKTKKSH